jgi:HAD superfamily hydrolase (TIGR01509 family)
MTRPSLWEQLDPSPEPTGQPFAHGLPMSMRGCLFDLDGVLTDTARVHAAAWKRTFDELLHRIDEDGAVRRYGGDDYRRLIDGRKREDGVRAFLASRDIALPEGRDDDGPEALTVRGLSARKDALFCSEIETAPPRPLPGAIPYLHELRSAGLCTGLVSASRHAPAVADAVGMRGLFDVVVDGNVAAEEDLAGKPAPDTFLEAARRLRLEPWCLAVVEDATSGVSAGRAGGFGYVVGIADDARAAELREAGADTVVENLGALVSEP